MDRNRAVEAERIKMQGLVVLLLSLAASCDRASLDPHALRCWVMSMLRDAPASALNLVGHHAAGFDMWLDLVPEDMAPNGNTSEDAAQLAHHFRVLAQVLFNLLAMLPQPERKLRGRDWLPLEPALRSGVGGPCVAWWRGRNSQFLLTRSRGPPRSRTIEDTQTQSFTSRLSRAERLRLPSSSTRNLLSGTRFSPLNLLAGLDHSPRRLLENPYGV